MPAITSTIDFNAVTERIAQLSTVEKVGYGVVAVIGLYILNAVLPRRFDAPADA
jgi:hypothetical protein